MIKKMGYVLRSATHPPLRVAMLALVLIALVACVRQPAGPVIHPLSALPTVGLAGSNPTSAPLTVQVDPSHLLFSGRPAGAYASQHVLADVKRLVVGVVDTYTYSDQGSIPYLGLQVTSGPAFSTATPSFHAAIAGTGSPYVPGALLFGGTGYSLTGAQKEDFRRYLYTTTTTLTSSPVNATFSGLRPNKPSGTNRYIAFAVALSTDSFSAAYPASDSFVVGFASASVSDPGGTTLVTPMPLTLNRVVGSLSIPISITNSSVNTNASIQELVVGAIATQSDELASPLNLGYAYDLAVGSTSEATATARPGYYSYFSPQIGGATGLTSTQQNEWPRFVWVHKSYSSAYPTPSSMTPVLSNVPATVGSGNSYFVYVVAFKQRTLLGTNSWDTCIGSASTVVRIVPGNTTSVPLSLVLNTNT